MAAAAMDSALVSEFGAMRDLNTWLGDLRREVLAIASRHVSADEAEDVAQVATHAAATRYESLTMEGARGYAFTCALNAIISRARRARVATDRLPALALDLSANEPRADARERAAVVVAACLDLPKELRLAALGAFVDGVGAQDLARTHHKSGAAMRQRLSRGRRMLRADPRIQALDPAFERAAAPTLCADSRGGAIDRCLHELYALAARPPASGADHEVSNPGVMVVRELEAGAGMLSCLDAAVAHAERMCASGRWDDATRWFGTLAMVAASRGDRLEVAYARLWEGHALRRGGRARQACRLYDAALAAATEQQDGELAALARFGRARVASLQGRLAESDVELDALLAGDRRTIQPATRALIMCDRAAVLMREADHALRWADADSLCIAASRLLLGALDIVGGRPSVHLAAGMAHDIGVQWMDLGFLDDAIAVLEVVHRSTTDVEQRLAAVVNLIIASARAGREGAFDYWAAESERLPGPPQLQAPAALNIGLGCMAFGRTHEARRALRRSLIEARARGFADISAQAHEAQAALESGHGRGVSGWPPRRARRPAGVDRHVRTLRAALDERLPDVMRALTGA